MIWGFGQGHQPKCIPITCLGVRLEVRMDTDRAMSPMHVVLDRFGLRKASVAREAMGRIRVELISNTKQPQLRQSAIQ